MYDVRLSVGWMFQFGVICAVKADRQVDCILQQFEVDDPGYFYCAESCQMWRRPLGVEQLEAILPKALHESYERDLGGVSRAAEHALAEKYSADGQSVEPTDEFSVFPRLH